MTAVLSPTSNHARRVRLCNAMLGGCRNSRRNFLDRSETHTTRRNQSPPCHTKVPHPDVCEVCTKNAIPHPFRLHVGKPWQRKALRNENVIMYPRGHVFTHAFTGHPPSAPSTLCLKIHGFHLLRRVTRNNVLSRVPDTTVGVMSSFSTRKTFDSSFSLLRAAGIIHACECFRVPTHSKNPASPCQCSLGGRSGSPG